MEPLQGLCEPPAFLQGPVHPLHPLQPAQLLTPGQGLGQVSGVRCLGSGVVDHLSWLTLSTTVWISPCVSTLPSSLTLLTCARVR